MELESEESECFHFFQFRLQHFVAYGPLKTRLSDLEAEAEAEEPTNHKAWK